MIEVRTFTLTLVAFALLLSCMLWLALRQARRITGVTLLAVGQFAVSLGVLAIMLGQMYRWPFGIVLGNPLTFLGYALAFAGILRFKGKNIAWPVIAGATGIDALTVAALVYVYPDASLRHGLISLFVGAITALCARELLIRVEASARTAYWLTGGAYAVFSAELLARAAGILVLGFPAVLLDQLFALTVFTGLVVMVCTSFGYVLMINNRMSLELERLASTDWLTGALNRRKLVEEANRWVEEGRYARIGVAMLDLDHFKSVNDRFGHPGGDKALAHFAHVAQATMRTTDLFARMGGEEFCLVLADAGEDEAMLAAERIRHACAVAPAVLDNVPVTYTLSAGVAAGPLAAGAFETLVRCADIALYQAKERGRDRVECYSQLASAGTVPAPAGQPEYPLEKSA